MTRAEAQRMCDRLNRSRDVREHTIGSADAARFCSRCPVGSNFLITGGEESQRTAMLLRLLSGIRQRSSIPVILLTGSALTERAVYQAATENRLGQARVFSPRSRDYHPLYRMSEVQISNLLLSIARQQGYRNTDQLAGYIRAFLAVVQKYHRLSLPALLALDRAAPTNEILCNMARACGAGFHHTEAIRSFPGGTPILHDLLELLSQAYGNLTHERCASGHDLSAGCSEGLLMCLRINSDQPEVLDLALAAELQRLLNEGRSFLLVLNDVPLCSAEGLYRQICSAKNVSSGTSVGICTADAAAWARQVTQAAEPENSLLSNTQTFVLFASGRENDSDLDGVLKYLGQFNRREVTAGGGHDAGLIHLFTSAHWEVSAGAPANRVRPQDLTGYRVVLKGHDGRNIHLYRSMTM